MLYFCTIDISKKKKKSFLIIHEDRNIFRNMNTSRIIHDLLSVCSCTIAILSHIIIHVPSYTKMRNYHFTKNSRDCTVYLY